MSESPGGSLRDARNGTKYGVPSTRRRGFLSDPREHARQGASADNDRGLMIFFPASERGTMRRRRRRGVRVDDSPPLFLVSVFFLLSYSPSFLPPCTWMSSHIGRGAESRRWSRGVAVYTVGQARLPNYLLPVANDETFLAAVPGYHRVFSSPSRYPFSSENII